MTELSAEIWDLGVAAESENPETELSGDSSDNSCEDEDELVEGFRSMNNKKGRKEVEGLEHLGFVFEYNGQPISMDKPGNGSKQGNYKGTVYLEKEAVQQVFSLACKRDYTHGDIWDPVNGAIVEGTRQWAIK